MGDESSADKKIGIFLSVLRIPNPESEVVPSSEN